MRTTLVLTAALLMLSAGSSRADKNIASSKNRTAKSAAGGTLSTKDQLMQDNLNMLEQFLSPKEENKKST